MPDKPDDVTPSPLQGEGWGEGTLVHQRNLKSVSQARRLRRQLTDVEKKLWYYLRARRFEGVKFRRQYPIGRYIVDFICTERKLIIELDGGQHATQSAKDQVREAWLVGYRYRILRFWNHEVIENINGVLETIQAALSNSHPGPLPEREREKDML